LYQEKAEVGWYREFGDTRRGKEISFAVQRFHLQKSREWLEREFGVTPLSFVAWGNGISESLPKNTTVAAARTGFGWFGDYIGPDLAIEAVEGYSGIGDTEFGGTDDAPLVVWIPPDGHDRGISRQPEGFLKIFDQLRGHRYIRMNEYVGYLHAAINQDENDRQKLIVNCDEHYCRYFRNHPSERRLEIPGLSGLAEIVVDERRQEVDFKEGTARVRIDPG
jgi:hypothetical protein